MRLLLVEDTPDVAEAIVASFARRGDAIDHAADAATARAFAAVQGYDVVILDINLPDGCGIELLREWRAGQSQTPVLMLTARFEVEDRVSALDSGADDYLVKPFDLRELEARVRALWRRQGAERGGVIEFGGLVVDLSGQTAWQGDTALQLSQREFSLLEALLASRGRIVSKERLLDKMFSFNDEDVGLNAIETYVSRLRKKLEGSRVSIRTLRGLGYQLAADG